MAEVTHQRVKSVYGAIKGYLNNLPQIRHDGFSYVVNVEVGRQYNNLLSQLSALTGTDYSGNLVDLGDVMYRHLDVRAVKMQMGSTITRLEEEYGFGTSTPTTTPAIAIFNTNQNKIDININFDIETLIKEAQNPEEKEHLATIKEELGKEKADWGRMKTALSWILNYSKELSLKILPIVLDYYLKRG